MAIVKMKKLQLMVVRKQARGLLRDLTKLGCVEITESAPLLVDENLSSILSSEYGGAVELTAKKNSLSSALGILDKRAPEKKGLLSARPEISEEEFFDDENLENELKVAARIVELEAAVRSVTSEESRLRGVAESMVPWMPLDMPLDTCGTAHSAVCLGTLPAAMNLEEAMAVLSDKVEEAELFEVSADKDQHYTVLVCLKDKLEDSLLALKEFGFSQASLGNLTGTAAENNARVLEEIEDCKAKR